MQLEDLLVVLKVAELGSITAAAASLDRQTAAASAALKRVEAALGMDLFIRTTRQLRLSHAGERYIPQCRQAVDMLTRARQNMQDDRDVVEGELRISVSSDLGRNLVTPWLDEILEIYPKVSLKLNVSDSNIDFYRDSVDIALRYGSPDDASVYGFKICDVPRLLCASPAYIDQFGAPEHPRELAAHAGLFYQLRDITYDHWKFVHNGTEFKIKMKGRRASNDGDLVRRWCVAGRGVALKSCLDMSADLLADKVLNLMPEFSAAPTELWIICPSRQSITPAVRLLRDLFRKKTAETLDQLIAKGVLPSDC